MKDDLAKVREDLKKEFPDLKQHIDDESLIPEWADELCKKLILDKTFNFLSHEEMKLAVLRLLSNFELNAFEILESLKQNRLKLNDDDHPAAILGIIYHLEEEHLIESKLMDVDGRSTKKYRVADEGRKQLSKGKSSQVVVLLNAKLNTL